MSSIAPLENDVSTAIKRDKVLKNGPSKICGRQPLKKASVFTTYLILHDREKDSTCLD